MAPEQIRGDEVDHRADIFAAGVVFYELLSGRKAFEGDSVATTMYKVLESHPQPVHLLDSAVPPALSLVVERALAKEKTARHQTSSELLDALLQIRGSSLTGRDVPTPAPPQPIRVAEIAVPAAPEPARRRPLVIVAAVIALAIGSGAYLMMTGRTEKARTPEPPAAPAAPPPEKASVPTVVPPAPTLQASRGTPTEPVPRRRSEPPQKPPIESAPAPPAARSTVDRTALPPDSLPAAVPDVPPPAPAPPPTVAPIPAPVVVVPPVATPPAPPPPSSDAAPSENPTDAIRAVLTRYQLALESRDMDALKRIWPGLSGRPEEAIKAEFDRARGIAVRLDDVNVRITAGVAAVSCRRDYAVTTGDGQTLKTATEMTMTLSRRNGAWTIDAIRHQVVR